MSPATALQEPVIDRQALDRHTMGNAALQQELFILFFDQMPVYLDQLDEAAASNDEESWRMAAHGIKGSSRALGFSRLAKMSAACETKTPQLAAVEELRALIEETRKNLEEA